MSSYDTNLSANVGQSAPSHPLTASADHEQADSELEFGRRTLFILSAIMSPLALTLLYNSVALLSAVGATGTPLGSPGGHLGLLIAAIFMALISHSSRWSTIGPAVLTTWAGIFALTLSHATWIAPPAATSEPEALLQWSQLPTIVFAICLAATLATRWVRRRRENGGPRNAVKYEDPLLTVLAFLLTFSILMLLFAAAPRSATGLIIREPSVLTTPTFTVAFTALTVSITAFITTWLATRFVVGVQLAVWVMLLIPGLVIIPVLTTFTNTIATPDNPDAIAVALTMPVAGAIGMVIAVTTHGIALMHKR